MLTSHDFEEHPTHPVRPLSQVSLTSFPTTYTLVQSVLCYSDLSDISVSGYIIKE